MSDPSAQAIEQLKAKALLLFQRERQISELSVARERASAWLRVFHHLTIEPQAITAPVLCEEWAVLMVRQLQFQTATAWECDAATGEFRLVAGKAHAPLPPSIRLDPDAHELLKARPDGICNLENAELSSLSRTLGLGSFLWSLLPSTGGPSFLFTVGFSPATATFRPPLTEDDLSSFQMLARHVSVLLSNRRLIIELQRERRQLETANAQYVVANRELEAFSYSVSHDLRAPLRSIDGFSQALLEDCADKLDAAGQNYARRVRAAAQRMGELIDDLLKLSRVGRAGLSKQEVDLSALARTVLAELSAAEPGRRVECVVENDLRVHADPHLMRILLDNLLGNAWKFTARTETPRIEVGAATQGGRRVYHVRDNGAGFNMKYVERLFRPFQRLHTVTEFAGTGIGLATVHRIVDRHSGQVWADAAPGRGATFYFAIPPNEDGVPHESWTSDFSGGR